MFKFNNNSCCNQLQQLQHKTCWKSLKKDESELTFTLKCSQSSNSQKQSVNEKLSLTTGWSIDHCTTVPAEPQINQLNNYKHLHPVKPFKLKHKPSLRK